MLCFKQGPTQVLSNQVRLSEYFYLNTQYLYLYLLGQYMHVYYAVQIQDSYNKIHLIASNLYLQNLTVYV